MELHHYPRMSYKLLDTCIGELDIEVAWEEGLNLQYTIAGHDKRVMDDFTSHGHCATERRIHLHLVPQSCREQHNLFRERERERDRVSPM